MDRDGTADPSGHGLFLVVALDPVSRSERRAGAAVLLGAALAV